MTASHESKAKVERRRIDRRKRNVAIPFADRRKGPRRADSETTGTPQPR